MIRVLVATDDCLYREGIEAILMAHEHTAVVEAAPDFFAAVASVDVALLDVTTRDSLTTLAGIRRCEQPPKVVAISVHDEPHTVLRWIESGCSGYVSRSATAGALLRAVRDTHHGELVFEPRLVSAVVNRLTSLAEKVAPNHVSPVALTAREKQILNLVSQGIPDKLIAAHLGISLATAKNHLHRVFEKTGVHSRHRLRMQIAD